MSYHQLKVAEFALDWLKMGAKSLPPLGHQTNLCHICAVYAWCMKGWPVSAENSVSVWVEQLVYCQQGVPSIHFWLDQQVFQRMQDNKFFLILQHLAHQAIHYQPDSAALVLYDLTLQVKVITVVATWVSEQVLCFIEDKVGKYFSAL